MQAAHVVPEVALARVVTAGGPYGPGDEISLAYTTPGIARLVAHDAGLRARCVPLERALIPEMISVSITHPAAPYRVGEIVTLSFVDPRIARVYSNDEIAAPDVASETSNAFADAKRPVASIANEIMQRRAEVAELRSGCAEQNVVARPLTSNAWQSTQSESSEMNDVAAEPPHDVLERENGADEQRIAVAGRRSDISQRRNAVSEGQNAVRTPPNAPAEQHDAGRERLDNGSARCSEVAETASNVSKAPNPEAARLIANIEQHDAGTRVAAAIDGLDNEGQLSGVTYRHPPEPDVPYAPESEAAIRQIRLGERMTMQAGIERPNGTETHWAPRSAGDLDQIALADDRTLRADYERGIASIEPLLARVSVRLEWNAERIRRFVQVVDKLFTMDRLGWYRHSLAMRLLIPDLITCADTLASVEAMRHLQALRAAAVEALGRPLLAACMPGFGITSQWLQTLESPREARAIAGLREALFPYAGDDEESSDTFATGALFTTGTVTRRELLPENATSVEAFLPLLIPAGSHDAVLNERLTEYRRLLVDLFAQTARAGEQVRLHQMAQPNHSLDDRLWQVVGAAAEAFGGFAHA